MYTTNVPPQQPTPAPHHHEYRRLVWLALVIVAALGLTAWLVTKFSPRRTIPQPTNTGSLITPVNYSDFYGQITAVTRATIVVSMTKSDAHGQLSTTSYTATINAATQLVGQRQTKQGLTTEPLALTDFHIGDPVQVFAGKNIATTTTFLATRILKLL